MIGGVIADLRGRVAAADLVHATDDTITVTVDSAGDVLVAADRSATLNLRVQHQGRLGWSAGPVERTDAVVAAALESATMGDPLELILPAPAPTASVVTSSSRAAAATPAELLDRARALRDRLGADDRWVGAWAERSSGRVEIGNTRGVAAGYDVTLAGIGASVVDRASGTRWRIHRSGGDLPAPAEIDDLVREVTEVLAHPVVSDVELPPVVRVWFRPRAVRGLLQPVLARLVGGSPEPGRECPPLDARVTLVDDPLAPLRPGSRPVDDDGVPTRRLTLVDRGRPGRGVLDLVTASRRGLPATGHGWRRGIAASRAGLSNLVMMPGADRPEDLPGRLETGLVVGDFDWGPGPDPAPGGFRAAAVGCLLVRGGEVVGRLGRVLLYGDRLELLNRVIAVGADSTWIGAACLPSVIVDRVGVAA